jgi:hypothetical protein
MKKLIFTLIIAASLFINSTVYACGIKPIRPIKPIGCGVQVAICFCDSNGFNCRWQWVCY